MVYLMVLLLFVTKYAIAILPLAKFPRWMKSNLSIAVSIIVRHIHILCAAFFIRFFTYFTITKRSCTYLKPVLNLEHKDYWSNPRIRLSYHHTVLGLISGPVDNNLGQLNISNNFSIRVSAIATSIPITIKVKSAYLAIIMLH